MDRAYDKQWQAPDIICVIYCFSSSLYHTNNGKMFRQTSKLLSSVKQDYQNDVRCLHNGKELVVGIDNLHTATSNQE